MDLHGAEVDAEARLEIGAGRVIERLSAAPNQFARAGGSPAWIGADVPRQRAERRRWCVARRVPRNDGFSSSLSSWANVHRAG
jgi:hypothetical protein